MDFACYTIKGCNMLPVRFYCPLASSVFLFIYSLRFHRFTRNFSVKFFCRSLFWIHRGIVIGEIKQYREKGNVFIRKLEISQNNNFSIWLGCEFLILSSLSFSFCFKPQLEVKNENTNSTCYRSESILEVHVHLNIDITRCKMSWIIFDCYSTTTHQSHTNFGVISLFIVIKKKKSSNYNIILIFLNK